MLKPLTTVLAATLMTATVGLAEDLEFTLVNNSSADLTAFHVSSGSSDSW
ncbi:hypothetical protein [Shimia abyssi]|uniref:Uncharacterized protein n=1 Tax=Shimia abyssi TaxID=1662395 RepID=A0A2P8FFW6_9RHOB|nr:hypothetical protein [Shimia abyssi]PSL20604.1 hypothetical protein CLV88_103252 [Shimia abyssi]